MEYRQIVAITGLSGLYQLMSTKNDGAIVRSLSDKSVKFVSARIHHITPLESIEIYTTGENIRLHEVLEKIKEDDSQVATLNNKRDDKAAKAYFQSILPDFDETRVYASDIRKVLKWYEILKSNDLLKFDYLKNVDNSEAENNVAVAEDVTETTPVDQEEEAKPKKKAAAKKAVKEGEEKPAKKTAAKKKDTTEASAEKPAAKKAPAKKKKEEA